MEYFDATEELHHIISEYRHHHNGNDPSRLYVSCELLEWILAIQAEQRLLLDLDPEPSNLNPVYYSEHGPIVLICDNSLSDYEIIAE